MSQRTTPTTLSRQGTLRASHRRKNSMTGSLLLIQGHKSPVIFDDQKSPQGRRSPLLLIHDHMRSPNEFPSNNFDARSPTRSPTERRSPTFSIHTQDRRSPVGTMNEYQRRSPTSTVHVQDIRGYELDEILDVNGSKGVSYKRQSISLFTSIPMSEKRSPILPMPIPPITVSNPLETGKIVERMAASTKTVEIITETEKTVEPEKEIPEKKERTSVMKEILAFVRKPSKRITTRTGRFAAAFSRTESGSNSGPLIRQSTFSASPAAASNAAKSAVTKQMSEVGFEPKMSLKFNINTKMSLKLRRSAVEDKKKDKKSSGDEASGTESDSKSEQVGKKPKTAGRGNCSNSETIPFELANVHFEKVGESYIKHEQLKEEIYENQHNIKKLKIVALSNENAQTYIASNKICKNENRDFKTRISEEQEFDPNESIEQFKPETDQLIKPIKPEPIYVNLMELRGEVIESENNEDENKTIPPPLQCPTIEFEPPSRRSSFDPPRSPYLENLRSPGGDTDTEFINLNRLDSGGDSFEMVEGDRNRESSFEDRFSSRDTSFDISRYQSTSYEDQTSSFEIVDIDARNEEKKSNVDLRKSSIELVDAETFQRSGSSGRKSSLETHFDYLPSENTPSTKPIVFPTNKKSKPDHYRIPRDIHISPFSAFSRARSPLSNQTSSNYSSRDSYDSSSSYPHSHQDQKSPYADPTKQHFPLTIKGPEEIRTFLCTDKRCASIFEPRTSSTYLSSGSGGTSGVNIISAISGSSLVSKDAKNSIAITSPLILNRNIGCGRPGCLSANELEFEPPSPRRAASASPKHTFTFRIVLKKVDSSPDAICPSVERRGRHIDSRYKRRDSRKKRLSNAGKSF